MKRLKDLATSELHGRLAQCRSILAEDDCVLHELQVHELELEIQNRELISAQRQIEESRDRYAKLYDFAPIGYLSVDANGVLQGLNLTAAGLLSTERSRAIGIPMIHFVAPADHRNWLDHLSRCKRQDRVVNEMVLQSGANAMPTQLISVNIAPKGEAGAYLTAMIDITERKRADEKLRNVHDDLEVHVKRRTEELRRANAMLGKEVVRRRQLEKELRSHMKELDGANRRKDEFLAMLSHELRNPLAPLRTCVELLKGAPSAAMELPSHASVYAMMERQLVQLVRLVDDLLDVSHISSGKVQIQLEWVDLRIVIGDAVDSARSFVDQRLHMLTLVLPEEPLWTNADPTRLHQMILNLLHNAAKYTDMGGQIHVSAMREDGEVAIRVCDNGRGISRELLPKIFEAFTQGERLIDRSEGGLGLGLALVSQLVGMHGGKVEAFSAGIDKGSEFIVHLPLAATRSKSAAAALSPDMRADGDRKHRRVLLVDDNVDFAEAAACLIQSWGHETCIANDGASAIECARLMRPDIVLLDIGLPGMDGYEVAAALRVLDETRNARIVAISGYSGEQYRAKARNAGFVEYFIKPMNPEPLQKLLEH